MLYAAQHNESRFMIDTMFVSECVREGGSEGVSEGGSEGGRDEVSEGVSE